VSRFLAINIEGKIGQLIVRRTSSFINIISEVCLLNDKTPKKHVCKSYTHAYGSLLMKEIYLRFNIEVVFFLGLSK
jgi:hypothetical protein